MRPREVFFVIFVILFGLSAEGALKFGGVFPLIRWNGPHFGGQHHDYVETREVPAAKASSVRLENAFGDVTIRGWDQPNLSVQLRKEIYGSSESKAKETADRVQIVVNDSGGEISISSNRRDESDWENRVRTSFELTVPNQLLVRAENSHGDLSVENLKSAGLQISNAFGDLSLRNAGGDATVRNEHGDVNVDGLLGNLDQQSSFGDARIVRITGNAKALHDHGDVHAELIEGGLHLEANFGDVTLANIKKDAELSGNHSSFGLTDCGGNVTVGNSFESVSVQTVAGNFTMTGDHSPVTFKDVGGAVKIETSFEDIEGTGVKGTVEIKVEHSDVDLRKLYSGCSIQSAFGDVHVQDFSGKVEVTAQHGECRLRALKPPDAPIDVRSDNGEVTLIVPSGATFQLLAETTSGDVNCNYPGLTVSRTEEKQLVRVTGSSGVRGPMIQLRTSFSDINVKQGGGNGD